MLTEDACSDEKRATAWSFGKFIRCEHGFVDVEFDIGSSVGAELTIDGFLENSGGT